MARSARYTVRSFVAWGVLKDTATRGCYEQGNCLPITDYREILTLLESGLLTTEEGKSSLGVLLNSPGFFPFNMTSISGDIIARNSPRIDVARYGIDDELLKVDVEKT